MAACTAPAPQPEPEMAYFKPCDPCIVQNPTTLEVTSSPEAISVFVKGRKDYAFVIDEFPHIYSFEIGDTVNFAAPRKAVYQLHVDITL